MWRDTGIHNRFFFLFVIYDDRVNFRYSLGFVCLLNVGQEEDIKCIIVDSGKKNNCFQRVENVGIRLDLPFQCSVTSVNMERASEMFGE